MRLFQEKTKQGGVVGWGYGIFRGIKEIAYVWNFQVFIKWNFQGWPRKNNDVEFLGAGVLIFGLGISNWSNTQFCGICRGWGEGGGGGVGGGALSCLEFPGVR